MIRIIFRKHTNKKITHCFALSDDLELFPEQNEGEKTKHLNKASEFHLVNFPPFVIKLKHFKFTSNTARISRITIFHTSMISKYVIHVHAFQTEHLNNPETTFRLGYTNIFDSPVWV